MRHGSQARRMRSNNGGNRGGHNPGGQRRGFQNKNRVFDSNGPDVRIRGTAYQIVEKYAALAKDASAAGDRVLAESYLQYAEHYQRIINSWADEYGDDMYEADTSSSSFDAIDVPPPAGTVPQQISSKQPSEADDLSLPSSILGTGSRAKTAEMADA